MKKTINFDYLSLWKEVPLFFLLAIILKIKKTKVHNQKILIVNPCLMGEFAASLPAITDFIRRNKDKKIDLMVSPPLKLLAEKIIGINYVYSVESVYKRFSERPNQNSRIASGYEEVILLRVSTGVFKSLKNVAVGRVKTGAWAFTRYALHLNINLIVGHP